MKVLSNLSLYGTLGLNSVADANTDTDKFLVIDSNGIVKYRTGQELYNDIGAGGAAAYTSVLQHEVKAGVALNKGQAVYVTSADGTNMIVGKASNASESTSSKTLGLVAQNLAINGIGFVVTEGLLAGIDTSTALAGDPVWLGTDGNLIFGLSNKPYAPAHLVFIGIVTRVQQNNGEIFVNVQNGFELNEIHNVQITSTPSDNTVLAYESSTSLYKMKSIATLLGYTPYDSSNPAGYISGITSNMVTTALGFTPVTNARTLTINGTTYDLSADRSWSVGTHTGSLTSGYIPKATGTTSLTDGLLYDTGSAILLGTQTAGSGKFMVYSTTADNHYQAIGSAPSLRFADAITNPTYTGIIGMATASNHFIIGAVAGDMVLSNNTNSAGNFLFGTGATERMRINATTGNISINNTNNTYKLDVTGTVRFTGQLRLESTITNGTYTYTLPSATGTLALTSQLTNGTVTSVGLSSSTSGVTIGSTPITTSGTITLAIATASGSQQGLLSSTDWTTFNNKQSALTNPVTGTGTTNYLPKFTGTSTIGNSIVSESGSVITIAGSLTATQGTFKSATASADVLFVVNSNNKGLNFNINSSDNAQISHTNTNQNIDYWVSGTGIHTFSTNGAVRMTLNASGNLGLGVTPSAWNSVFKVLESGDTNNQTAIAFQNNANVIYLTTNSYFDTSWKYKFSDNAGQYLIDGNEHRWYNAPSGTAGNAISFTQAMTLDASGRLSIGNTSVSAINERLNVTGNGIAIEDSDGGREMLLGHFGGADGILGTFTNDALQIRTNNTARLTIASTGAATFSANVGIGGSPSSTASLDINNGNIWVRTPSAVRGIQFGYSDSTHGSYRAAIMGGPQNYGGSDDGMITFHTQNGYVVSSTPPERMRITSGGNVGIGTTSPGGTLELLRANDSGVILRIGNAGSTYFDFSRSSSTGALSIQGNQTGNNNILLAPTSGNVGIGTTSPSGKLGIYGSAIGDIPLVITHAWGGSSTALISASNASAEVFKVDRNGAATFSSSVRSNSHIIVSDGSASVVLQGYINNALRIAASGSGSSGGSRGDLYVGAIDVGGAATFSSSVTATTGYYLKHSNGNTIAAIEQFSGTQGAGLSLFNSSGTQNVLFNAGGDSFIRGGNVGIGTTSPSFAGGGGLHINQGGTDTRLHLTNSTTGTAATDGFELALVGNDVYYDSKESAGTHIFYTAGSERMRITSGGNVGIGTTSPGAKLEVTGNIYANESSSTAISVYNTGSIRAKMSMTGNEGDLTLYGSSATAKVYLSAYYNSYFLAGSIGIGTSTPTARLDVNGSATLVANFNYSSSGTYVRWQNNGNSFGDVGSASQLVTGGSTNDFTIHARSTYNMIFANNFVERMRITSSGDVLVNATLTTQMAKFYVNGKGAFGSLYIGNLGTGTVYSNAGNLTNTNPSDYRLKNTITPLTYGLNEVLQLNPKTFYYNDDVTKARLKYGFIAQEVKDVMPDLVRRLDSETDYLGLENEGIFVTLVNAIKEQNNQIKEQQAQINELKSQLNK